MLHTRTIEKIIFLLATLALVSPLVFIETAYIFPFIVPKTLFFRITVALMLGGYLVLAVSHKKLYGFRPNVLHYAIGFFFLSLLTSTFIGVDWYKSMWDSHERMLGLFTISHYIIYYLACVCVIREWKDWRRMLQIFLIVGSIVMLLGVWQKFVNPDALLNRGSDRVSATLGNTLYFSAFGMFLIFMGCYSYAKERSGDFSRLFSAIAVILGFIGLFLGGSRGMLIGTIAGLFVAFVSYWITYRKNKRVCIVFSLLCATALLTGSLLFIYRQSALVYKVPAIARLVNTDLTDFGNNTRGMAWGIALEAWKEKPLFGWGPNNYYVAFDKYYRPKFLEFGWNETWFDNAHNVIVNTLAVQGITGLLAYLSIFGAAGYLVISARRRDAITIHEAIILCSFLTAHFVSNIFIFENPTSYLYFFFTLGLICVRIKPDSTHTSNTATISTPLIVAVALLIGAFIYATDILPGQANRASLRTIRALYSAEMTAIDFFDDALRIPTPHLDDLRGDFARSSADSAALYIQKGRSDYAKQLLVRAFMELEQNKITHPYDIRNHIEQATIARRLAEQFNDSSYLDESETILEEALIHSPKRQQILYMLSLIKGVFGKQAEAIALLEQSIKDNPNIAEGWWRLAHLYWSNGNTQKAVEVITDAQSKHVNFDDQGKQVIARILSSVSSTPSVK